MIEDFTILAVRWEHQIQVRFPLNIKNDLYHLKVVTRNLQTFLIILIQLNTFENHIENIDQL